MAAARAASCRQAATDPAKGAGVGGRGDGVQGWLARVARAHGCVHALGPNGFGHGFLDLFQLVVVCAFEVCPSVSDGRQHAAQAVG